MAPSFFTYSSPALNFTPEASHIPVIKEWNTKAVDFCFLVTKSQISFSMIFPISMVNLFTMTYMSISQSYETIVVWVVGINLDFKNLTQTLAMCFKLILLITRPSSFIYALPGIVKVLNTSPHFLTVIFSTIWVYSHSITVGKS